MSKRVIEIAVGLFVLFGLAMLMVLAVKVSGLSNVFSGEHGYTLTADFENVGGLKPRAKISIGGVQVGRVIDIQLDQEHFSEGTVFRARVQMTIDSKINNLPLDTQAHILTSGLLGDNFISLEPGYSKEFLKPNGHIILENTQSALILEELISNFVSGKASGYQ